MVTGDISNQWSLPPILSLMMFFDQTAIGPPALYSPSSMHVMTTAYSKPRASGPKLTTSRPNLKLLVIIS